MKLIINADDLGLSEKVNRNIIFCHQHGIVSSASVLAGGECFEAAARLAKENPELGLGVHLALDGPLNIGTRYKTLTNPETGRFFDDRTVLKKIKTGSLNLRELITEYSLQIERIQNAGLRVFHFDHHHHFHLFFPVLKAVVTVAKKYRIPFIRPQRILYPQNRNVLKSMYREAHHFYLKKTYHTIDGYSTVLGCPEPETKILQLMRILSSGNREIELVVHATEEDDEFRFLTSETCKSLVRKSLTSYKQLSQPKTRKLC